jgi:hypothetical protein
MTAPTQSGLTRWIAGLPPAVFSIYAIAAAFTTYFCMYAFRKPFAAGTFDMEVDLVFLPPMHLKILFIISQVLGYCTSKFIGIKVISELNPAKRAVAILLTIGVAELALLLFAVVPAPWNAVCLVLNGLPLGMVWGLVFGFLEGRRVTEVLGAGLSVSYIVASGVVKGVGKSLIDSGISEWWMPFLTGLVFFPLLILSVFLLSRLPPPTPEDEALRVRREPMDGKARTAFVRRFFPGLFFLTFLYIFLTAYRDFRDNFAVEIWAAIGFDGAEQLATAETKIAFLVVIALGFVMLVRNNRVALLVIHVVMLIGTALIGLSTMAWQAELIAPDTWMIAVGFGLYLAYVPYGCILFDRLIAAVGVTATAGFMIYVTDAFGYAGSVGLLLWKNFGEPDLSWLDFFVKFSYAASVLCSVCFVISMFYFARVARRSTGHDQQPAVA